MKVLVNYLQNREDAIMSLLKKPSGAYKPATFHKLRVEIKKLNALFELIKFCSKDFRQTKTFKPIKRIFRQAGKVRDLQVEEAILKQYFQQKTINTYRIELKKRRLKERNDFFSKLNGKSVSEIKNNLNRVKPFAANSDKEKTKNYLKRKNRKIEKLIHNLEGSRIHELRKELKKIIYNRKCLKPDKKGSDSLNDELSDTLGKWHDYQIMIRHLNKTINKNLINQKEVNELKKISNNYSFESDALIDKMHGIIATSVF